MILSEVSPHPSPLTSNDVSWVIPLRIGILMDHPSPHMVTFLDALAVRDDCIAHVIYLAKSAPERKWGAPLGKLPSRFIRGFSFLGGGRRMNPGITRALEKQKADVWVVNTCYDSPSTVLAAWLLEKRKTPWVYMNEPPRPRSWLFNASKSFPFQFVAGRARGLIGMGEKTAEIYRQGRNGSIPTSSIPYFIDLKPFYDLPGAVEPQPGMPVHFLTCCQMIHRKGLDVLLQACSRLTDSNWQLTLIGGGPLRRKLEQKFHERFSTKQIIFGGEIPYENRQEAFRQKQVFVFPSRWDGWGMVLPEALAAGLPVIATDRVISAHEFIRNGSNGFIVPTENPQALAEKMEYLIHHREEIAKMGAAARRSVLDYLPEKGAERLVKFLKDLVNHSRQELPSCNQPRLENYEMTWESLTCPNSFPERVRRKTRQLAKKTAIRFGNSLSMRDKPNSHRILLYHVVLPQDRKSFEEHIRFLKDQYLLCSIPEVYETACNPQTNGSYRSAITFDDGFRILMPDCLEILQKHGVKATFLVPTGFVELWDQPSLACDFSLRAHYYSQPMEPMRPMDLKTLTGLGHSIGSHGISHISISSMPRPRALKELKLSRQRIAAWTGEIPELFAYPYGDVAHADGDPSTWVKESGYSFGLTLRRGPINSTSDPMALPREHAEGNWSVQDLKYFLFR